MNISLDPSPRSSFRQSTPNDSGTHLAAKNELYGEDIITPVPTPTRKSRSRIIWLIALVALVLIIAAVMIPVYFTVIKPATASSQKSGGTSHRPTATGSAGGAVPTGEPTSGGDGSTVRASDGSTFTYNNKFGGIWVSDPDDPYNNGAYPNEWTPPLNQTWDFGRNQINGVNLGGWFVLEPFISPALYQKYPGAIDEWTLSTLMAADTASGGLNQLEDHYKTFITEADFAEIAQAGLNWVRLPIPHWAVQSFPGEPFLAQTSWKYIVQAFQWCRKYGLRVELDLHTTPGSQNGYDHSGKKGQVNFLHGVMGVANAQTTLNIIRIITEFISQPQWKDIVVIFNILNEPLLSTIGETQLRGFYLEAYKTIRGITGIGEGKGPYISIGDGFSGLAAFVGFLTGADRLAIEMHPYFAFNGGPATDPIDTGVGAGAGGTWPQLACTRWAASMNTSRTAFGVTLAGEWSNGFNDCGLFMTGVGGTNTYGGNCADWQDASKWTDGTKAGILAFASASMDALRDYFFWTWKIGNSTAGHVESPLWSYQLGYRGGWIPSNPRSVIGVCGASAGPVFDQTFDSWMTGGAGAGDIAAAQTAQYPFPPAEIAGNAGAASLLPTYTATGSIATLAVPTYTDTHGNTIDSGNGWFNPQDTQPAPTPIAGCTYPDPWNALTAPVPAQCGGGAAAPAVTASASVITPPPTPRRRRSF